MAILVETSSVKHYTGITTTSYDELITDMELIILDDITNYCKNSFVNSTMYYYDEQISFSTSTGNNTIFTSDTSFEFTDYLIAGNAVKITGTIFNDGYYSVNEVGSTYMIMNESINTESTGDGRFPAIFKADFPKDLAFTASRMIRYLIDSQKGAEMKSERLGDYSYTLQDIGSNQYPKNITGGLTKYRKIRML